MPEFVAKRPARYRGKRLKDLCGEMHAFFRDAGVSQLQRAQFAAKHLPEMVMTPREASRHLVRNNVDYLPLAALEGRVATTLFVVYPPGIATIVPGERLSERARPMIEYLKMFEQERQRVPGLRSRDPGPLSRGRRFRGDSILYLRGPRDARLNRPRACKRVVNSVPERSDVASGGASPCRSGEGERQGVPRGGDFA